MGNLGKFETYIVNQIISKFPFGYTEAVQIINLMKSLRLVGKNITSEAEADDFVNQEVKTFLTPKGLLRFKTYSGEELKKLGISLKFLRDKNDGWGTKIYYDAANDLYWEDAPGRYTNGGYQLCSDDINLDSE
jgi:hypothetical protein